MIRRILGPIRGKLRKRSALGRSRALANSTDPRLAAIGKALAEAISGDFAAEEARILRAIETRRQELLSDQSKVVHVDFGAGSDDIKRTVAESRDGVEKTKSLATIATYSKPELPARILYAAVKNLAPNTCIELGSCVGISAAYQAAALNLKGGGRLYSLEGAPALADVSRETLKELGLPGEIVTGPFHDTLSGVLEKTAPVDFLFNDGHHDGEAVRTYFDQSLDFMADKSIVFVDDIRWSPSMYSAWTDLISRDVVSASIDLRSFGILLLDKQKSNSQEHVQIFL